MSIASIRNSSQELIKLKIDRKLTQILNLLSGVMNPSAQARISQKQPWQAEAEVQTQGGAKNYSSISTCLSQYPQPIFTSAHSSLYLTELDIDFAYKNTNTAALCSSRRIRPSSRAKRTILYGCSLQHALRESASTLPAPATQVSENKKENLARRGRKKSQTQPRIRKVNITQHKYRCLEAQTSLVAMKQRQQHSGLNIRRGKLISRIAKLCSFNHFQL